MTVVASLCCLIPERRNSALDGRVDSEAGDALVALSESLDGKRLVSVGGGGIVVPAGGITVVPGRTVGNGLSGTVAGPGTTVGGRMMAGAG